VRRPNLAAIQARFPQSEVNALLEYIVDLEEARDELQGALQLHIDREFTRLAMEGGTEEAEWLDAHRELLKR
jgi:hypothetical protein